MDLSNENVIHIKKEEVEYLQFRKLLQYEKQIKHAYSLGLDKNYRTAKINKEKLPEQEYEKAMKDYEKLCQAIGSDKTHLVKTNQEHTDKVKVVMKKIKVDEPDFNLDEYSHTDGLITNKKNILLATTNADCILLLFYDPIKNVIANVHSGWKGTIQRISAKTVQKMEEEFQCNPKDIICCICPSIRKCHFEVKKEVKDQFVAEFQDLLQIQEMNKTEKWIEETETDKKWNIDTVWINKELLKREGLKEENIIDSKICSMCHSDKIHSYRTEKEKYGLNTAVLELLSPLGTGTNGDKTTIPNRIKKGDTIGVVAPSGAVTGKNIDELEAARKIVEKDGFKVKYSKNIFSNTLGYSATAKEKAQDINEMFSDEEVKMIWCAKGGSNSNCTFDFLDYETIKQNPKIICGYSDITSLTNIITQETGLVTFSGTNFKTIATDETRYSYQEAIKRFCDCNIELGRSNEKYYTIQEGQAEGILIGGNLNLIHGLVAGKYVIDFKDKILFLEEFGMETDPALASNFLYYMKQNGVFEKIKGLWIGSYEHESGIGLEKIVKDVLEDKYNFPIIKSNNFGHIETKIVIPIGTKARIDTRKEIKIELIEKCVK